MLYVEGVFFFFVVQIDWLSKRVLNLSTELRNVQVVIEWRSLKLRQVPLVTFISDAIRL